ncbi:MULTISPECIES: hypothetical protein [unclassified Azospirillum]|uniref:hypothetical protein n=1 Tax=unclassified Azospirillum TaxID=2630922 RepID=UPI000B63749A|nr:MULTISPECIES: hypothetical protein [unclassified Azospirillum]SNR83304.1 hypothetical protein SAMN05880556_1015 [Azospirillum sp. RU38E]SNR98804.1 hypothetical protein SAMN05880591_1015 [Azospirillum sp. RU37A]
MRIQHQHSGIQRRGRFATLAIASLILCSSPAWAGCEIGDPPNLPDGSSATASDMAEAAKMVKSYIAATDEYQACLTAEGKVRGRIDADSYNKSTERMEKLAADFNKRLKAFKSRAG